MAAVDRIRVGAGADERPTARLMAFAETPARDERSLDAREQHEVGVGCFLARLALAAELLTSDSGLQLRAQEERVVLREELARWW